MLWVGKYFKKKKQVSLNKSGLEFAFTDSNGTKYYWIPEKDKMILDRMGMIQSVLDEISCGVSEKELTGLIDYALAALTPGKDKSIDLTKVGFALHEIKHRKEMLVHPELALKLVAWLTVREDEDPTTAELSIHFEKITQFRADIDKGLTPLKDFFLQPRIMGYLPFINGISENLEKYWEEGNLKTKSLQTFLHLHLPTQDASVNSLKTVKTSTLG